MRPGSPARGATWPSRSAASTSSSCRRRRRGSRTPFSRRWPRGSPWSPRGSAAIPSWSWRKTGTLVPSSDPAALAGAIARYAGSPVLVAAHGAAGRARACAEFSLARMVSRYADLYDAGVRHPGVLDPCRSREGFERPSIAASALFLLALGIVFAHLGEGHLANFDDCYYAQKAKEMLRTGDWITPATTGRSRSTTRPSSSSSWPGRSCSSGCATTPRSPRQPSPGCSAWCCSTRSRAGSASAPSRPGPRRSCS